MAGLGKPAPPRSTLRPPRLRKRSARHHRGEGGRMSESEIDLPEGRLDEDDRLKPEYVTQVMERVEAGDDEAARALVEPLHPADLADLFELVDSDDRRALAAAIADLLDGDVLAEMNEHVREELIDALDPR